MADTTHTDSEYRVVLTGIDPLKETPETFAVKFAMTVKTPLPRVQSWVKKMPAVVRQHLSEPKAKRLAALIEDLGGVAEVTDQPIGAVFDSATPRSASEEKRHRGDKPSSSSGAARSDAGELDLEFESPLSHQADTEPASEPVMGPDPYPQRRKNDPVQRAAAAAEAHVERQRSAQSATATAPRPKAKPLVCSACEWEEEPGAKFCSVCGRPFEEDIVHLSELQSNVKENPLTTNRGHHGEGTLDKLRSLPVSFQVGMLGGLLLLLALVIFAR